MSIWCRTNRCVLQSSAIVALALAAIATSAATLRSDAEASERKALPAPLVYLRDIDPTILQDMRYAGPDNFTGAPVPGYAAPECILTRRTAEALAAVQRKVAQRNLSLKVYDCYRPTKAVAAFMRWVGSKGEDAATARFHPVLPRDRLVSLGYIAARSGHSRGHTVDLTLVALPRGETPAFEPGKIYGACTANAKTRAPDDGVDMGTGYDCFDPQSHDDASLSGDQQNNRRALADAMASVGFEAYDREWWHFSFPAGDPGHAYDVDVTAHPGPE